MIVYLIGVDYKVKRKEIGKITEYREDGFRFVDEEGNDYNFQHIPHEIFAIEEDALHLSVKDHVDADDMVWLEENDVYLINVRNITPEPTMQELKKESEDLKEALDFLLFAEGGELP